MELIEKQSAEANLHLLFGRTEHFNRQQVITIMQPAIRSELNDWIELPRCPSSGPHYLDKPGFDPKACPMIGWLDGLEGSTISEREEEDATHRDIIWR
jgi:hypothetical protein